MPRSPKGLRIRLVLRIAARVAFAAAATLSALLCLALSVLGVRSLWVWEDVYFFQAPAYASRGTMPFLGDLRSSGGGLSLGFLKPRAPLPPEEVQRTARDFPPRLYERIPQPPIYPRAYGPPGQPGTTGSPRWLGRVGVSWASWPSRSEFATYMVWMMAFPYWLPALLAAVLPAGWVLSRRRRSRGERRHRRGLCRVCGYDLRATPEAAGPGAPLLRVCPECGSESR